MQGAELRRHHGGLVAVADDGPGQRAEDLQDPGGGGRGAGPVFGVERKVPESGFGHGVALAKHVRREFFRMRQTILPIVHATGLVA